MSESKAADAAFVNDPRWYAHRFDPERDLYHIIPAARAERSAAMFLTDENLPAAARPRAVDRRGALAAADRRAPVGFILHSAFCCSTLLARALDVPGVTAVLKEPVILNDIVGWKRRGAPGARVAEALDHGLRMLALAAAPGETLLVKPSNGIAMLAPACLALRPEARAILLYAPLETFLASIASKGLEGRLWVRDLWGKLLSDGVDAFGFSADELFRHSDLQVAALGWLAQHRVFAELATRFGERIATLDSPSLLADPARTIAAAARHYDMRLSTEQLDAIAQGPVFTRHAKSGERFDARARDTLHGAARDAHRGEIAMVDTWARAVARASGVSLTLPRALLG